MQFQPCHASIDALLGVKIWSLRAATLQKCGSENFSVFSLPKVSWNVFFGVKFWWNFPCYVGLGVRGKIFGLPRKQKIAVNKLWVQESEMGEECRQFWTWILGVNFLGGLKPWKNKAEKFAIKIRHQNLLRNSPAIFLKFAGPKKKPKSALHNVGTKKFTKMSRRNWCEKTEKFHANFTLLGRSAEVSEVLRWRACWALDAGAHDYSHANLAFLKSCLHWPRASVHPLGKAAIKEVLRLLQWSHRSSSVSTLLLACALSFKTPHASHIHTSALKPCMLVSHD